MGRDDSHTFLGDFRTFFVRGVAVLLPAILTLSILWYAFSFLFANLVDPINRGVRFGFIEVYPRVVSPSLLPEWFQVTEVEIAEYRDETDNPILRDGSDDNVIRNIRRQRLSAIWDNWAFGVLDLTGLVIAIVLLYLSGRLLGSFLGRWSYSRLETLLQAVPGFKQVYPHVKQVVDLIMGDQKMAFSRVVLIQYPREGIWTVGLVTSSSLKPIADEAGSEVLCVFVPTSPTPFTGFTVNVKAHECVDVDMTIEQALRFVVTAGVLVPEKHQMPAVTGVPQLHVVPVQEGGAADDSDADGTGRDPDQVEGSSVAGAGGAGSERDGPSTDRPAS
ncbi:MAG: DUF502 domain-containing protein [Planctomycetota bacterium]